MLEHGLELSFTTPAVEAVARRCAELNLTTEAFWDEQFGDLKYGLELVARNTGCKAFQITKRFVQNPAGELSRCVAESFKKDEADGSE